MAKKTEAEAQKVLATVSCIVRSRLTHDGKEYEPGDEIELTEAQAEALLGHTILVVPDDEAKTEGTGQT